MSDQPLTDVSFSNFALHPLLAQGIEAAGFMRCTPIQAMTLPVTLEGKDVAGQAQTGTGKTAAFLVALYQRLLTRAARVDRQTQDPRAVILAPTRELAVQIDKDAMQLGRFTGLRTALIYGGVNYDKQREALEAGVDVIIATPGRLIDFVKQRQVSMRAVEVMIIDEADRMFDLGFIRDIYFLLRRMPPPSERQNLMFSATLSHRVLELAYEHMNSPEKLVVESESITAARVRQAVYFPATEEKMPLLLGLLAQMDANRSIVFVNTKIACERVALTLERANYRVGVLSGDVPQKKRESLLARFVQGDLSMLVATDVAARGLHIPGVSHVFNFDLPLDAEDYVHRIGRTARLGAEGDAISFACDEYAMSLPDIEAFIEQKIPVVQFDPSLLLPVPTRALSGGGERLIEDAFSEAAAERKRRRARTDGRSPSGPSGRGGPRSHNRPERAPAASKHPPAERPARAARVAEAATNPSTDEQPRTHRRRGGRRHRQDEQVIVADASVSVTPVPVEAPAKVRLRTRIKQTIKSWFKRLGMPRGARR